VRETFKWDCRIVIGALEINVCSGSGKGQSSRGTILRPWVNT